MFSWRVFAAATIFSTILQFASAQSTIKVLRNTWKIADYGVKGGATLSNPGVGVDGSGVTDLNEVTICFRFRLKVLGRQGVRRGMLLNIGEW